MSWSVVGFLSSLVPWVIMSLTVTDVVCLPCRGMGAASLKALWGVAATVALVASTAGLLRRTAVGWAIAGLASGLVVAVHLALADPILAATVAIPIGAFVFAAVQWR